MIQERIRSCDTSVPDPMRIAQYLLKEKSDLYPLQIGADTPHYGVDPHNSIKQRYTISYIKPSVTATVDTGS